MALYQYNVAVAQLDKDTGAYRKNLPAAKEVKAPFRPLPFLKYGEEEPAVKPVKLNTTK